VFQLPYVAFGSYTNQVGKMEPYVHFTPYVHSRTSRWSFGAMYGRPEEAELARLGQLPPDQLLPVLVAYEYKGVYVDRSGYADGGAAIEGQLRQLTGAEPVVSEGGRLAFYPLVGYEGKLKGDTPADRWEGRKREVRDHLHTSPLVRWGKGFDPEVRTPNPGWEQFRWVRLPGGSLHLTNRTQQTHPVRIRFAALTHHPGDWKLRVKGVGVDEVIGVSAIPTEYDRVVQLPPGEHTIRLVCNAPPYDGTPNALVFTVNRPTIELVAPPPQPLAAGGK
jgi:phosphoglycerol transferase